MLFYTYIIGLLSGVLAEKEYIRDGKIVKMVIIEITDDRCVFLRY